jgi:hypothetical protein
VIYGDSDRGDRGLLSPWTLTLQNPSPTRVLIDTIRMESADGASSGGGSGCALEPGQTASIQMRIPIPVNEGRFERTVVIEGNTKPSQTRIRLKGVAGKPWKVEPSIVEFTPTAEKPAAGQTTTTELTFTRPCSLGTPQCAENRVTTRLEVIQPGSHYRLHVSLNETGTMSPLSALIQLPIHSQPGESWPAALQVPIRVHRAATATL